MSESGGSHNSTINVSFSILGNNFSLRCRESQKDSLESAIHEVQELCGKILRENPNLTPQQASILCAIESQSKLIAIHRGETPFSHRVQGTMNKIYNNLDAISKSIEKIHNK